MKRRYASLKKSVSRSRGVDSEKVTRYGTGSNTKRKEIRHAGDAEIWLYDRLFAAEQPDAEGDYLENLNQESLQVVIAKYEPALAEHHPASRYQL